MLVSIKLLHTAVWLFFVLCIAGIPVTAARRRFALAAALSGMVLLECAALAVNGGRCPLTDLAARYTLERADNFDIYLPLWLAQYNKAIFGSVWVAGEVFLLGRWWASRQSLCVMRKGDGGLKSLGRH
ncbi:MAG TPA: hypothetical protein VF865_04315 [Acidobacteriaceae bacterium]